MGHRRVAAGKALRTAQDMVELLLSAENVNGSDA